MELRVLIADDDDGMRLVLKKAIERVKGFVVVNEAKDGEEALRLFESLQPHIIFMDVEMPILNGIECAKKVIDINPKTIIVFATAHEVYMPDAFALYAFDYMVKPFKLERIHKTLSRIQELTTTHKENPVQPVIKYEKSLERLIIHNKDGISFINMEDIILVERENRSTILHTKDDQYVTSEGLSEIEERLDKNLFFRCHKSYIINLSMIHKILPYGRWTYIIKLKNTEKDALLTHDRYEVLVKVFGV